MAGPLRPTRIDARKRPARRATENIDIAARLDHAHPTGRLIGKREPYGVDMAAVVRAPQYYGVMLEVNAQPDRLDLADIHIELAPEAGVPLVVSTEAHRAQELDFMRCGVDQARRAWCEPGDVANTGTDAQFRKLLAR